MAEIDYRDVPAPGMGVGAGMMRAMRRVEPELARSSGQSSGQSSAPSPVQPSSLRTPSLRLVESDPPGQNGLAEDGPRGLFRSARAPSTASRRMPPAPGFEAHDDTLPHHETAEFAEPGVRPAARPRGERTQRLVNGAGALVSLVLVAGLALWGYRLAIRDVTGIPVIRALEGPARVAPDDPGGELARHQGLSVNDVTADGTAAPAPDRLVLAPRAEGLADDDVAMAALAEGAGATAAALSIEPAVPDPAATEPLTGQPLGPDGQVTDPMLADGLLPAAPELRPVPRPGPHPAAAASSGEAMLAPASAPLSASGEDADIVAALAAAEASITPPKTDEIDPATLPSGTRLVQIDTYDSADAARAGWDAIADAFPDVMTGKRRVIEAAGDSGTSFFRLRAEGFADVEDARRFCSVLKPRVPTCVPALVK